MDEKITINVKKASKHKKSKNICVEDTELLYLIADAGLLHTHLRGIQCDKKDKHKFLWFFKRDIEIRTIVDRFKTNRSKTS